MGKSIYVAIPVMALLAILQTAVLPFFPVFNVSPQLPLLMALSWGLLRGIEEGFVWAFIAGLFMDIFSITPLGMTALTYMIAVTAVVWLSNAFPTSRVIMPVLAAALTTIFYMILYLIVLRIGGVINSFNAIDSLLPITLLNSIAILPIYWITYVLTQTLLPRRVQL